MRQSSVVVDTNVVSFIFRRSQLGARYEALISQCVGHIAPVTIAEMHFGAYVRSWGPARWSRLNRLLGSFEVLTPTTEIAKLAGYVMAERRRAGRPLDWNDAWIAATALSYGFPLVTHDNDFGAIESLELLSELGSLRVSEARCHFGRSHLPRRFRRLALVA